ncbi:secreted protein [Mycobacterium tuberculosis]|nr:secreted protein [Mycobacterium tuberculosis]
MPGGRPFRWSAALAVVAVLAAGCGGAVQVPVPSPDAAGTRLCEGLRLPEKVHGQERRDTSPDSPLTAAWGSPAIALRCGVPRPAALRPASQLVTINGIDWFGTPTDRPVTWTAVGRQAYVEVTVPPKYDPAGDVLIELGPSIKATIPAKPEGQI